MGLPTANRVYQTSNDHIGAPDIGRVVGLTGKFLEQGKNWATAVAARNEVLTRLILHSSGGICGGMVCDWAKRYVKSGNPEVRPDIEKARQLQGHALVTTRKRSALDKPDPMTTANAKMFDSNKLLLRTLVTSQMPGDVEKYDQPAHQMAGWVSLLDNQVLQAGIALPGGNHALGLLFARSFFYLLEPNQGLYRFGTEEAYRENLQRYLESCPPGSAWSLYAVSKRPKPPRGEDATGS